MVSRKVAMARDLSMCLLVETGHGQTTSAISMASRTGKLTPFAGSHDTQPTPVTLASTPSRLLQSIIVTCIRRTQSRAQQTWWWPIRPGMGSLS
jgi:hypothetical protein